MWILLFFQLAFADTVMVKAPQADPDTYQVFLENSDTIRPSDMELGCAVADQLHETFEQANDNFLNGSVELATKQFRDVSELQWSCDWRERDRKLISEAQMRLAQLAPSEEQKKSWLMTLSSFDPTYSPPTNVFPPPLVTDWNSARNSVSTKTLFVSKYSATYVKVVRNGRPFTIGKKSIKVPAGQARYTFYSDSHYPKTVIMEPNEIAQADLSSAPYLNGDCKNFEFQKPAQWKAGARLFFDPECVIEKPDNTLFTAQTLATPSVSSLPNAIDMQLEEDRMPKKNWVRRNAVWIGTAAAIIGTAIVISEMSKRKDTQTVITPTASASGN